VSATLIIIYIAMLNWSFNKTYLTISKSEWKYKKFLNIIESQEKLWNFAGVREKLWNFRIKNLWQPAVIILKNFIRLVDACWKFC